MQPGQASNPEQLIKTLAPVGTSGWWSEKMQDVRLECTLDGNEYKEYKVFFNNQPLGVVSWDHEGDPAAGRWHTTASDGYPQYFQTQEQVIDFLTNTPSHDHKLSARLKGEAQRLTAIAQELEVESDDLEAQGQ